MVKLRKGKKKKNIKKDVRAKKAAKITNEQKKKMIDGVFANYRMKMSALEKKRDKIISNFLNVLKETKINELRNSLK